MKKNTTFGGFLKYGYPQIIQFNGISLINHPIIIGYPHFRKPPFFSASRWQNHQTNVGISEQFHLWRLEEVTAKKIKTPFNLPSAAVTVATIPGYQNPAWPTMMQSLAAGYLAIPKFLLEIDMGPPQRGDSMVIFYGDFPPMMFYGRMDHITFLLIPHIVHVTD